MTDHERKTEAQQRLALSGIQPGQRFRHYKGGFYCVVCLSIKEDDLTPLVTYQSETYGTLSTRTLDNWRDMVEMDGKSVQRFTETA